MELHAQEGTRSEAGVKRRNGKRVTKQTTVRTTVGGRNGFEPPADLDAECLAAWHELRQECASVLDDADAKMLELAAVATGRFRQARAAITKHGSTLEVTRFRYGNETTEVVDNPAVKQEQTYALMLHRACVALGIGPSPRAAFSGIGVEGMQASEALNGVADLVAIRGGRA